MNALESYYIKANEEKRLLSRHGQVEYFVTMHYIQAMIEKIKEEKEITHNSKISIIDVGAGTGRYSVALAEQGYDVTAVDLLNCNIDIMKEKNSPIKIYRGNAMDLGQFPNERFDIVIMLGPMYHVFGEDNKIKVLSESFRLLKPGGIILVAYCLNEYNIVAHAFVERQIGDFLKEKKISKEFCTIGTEKDVFDYVRIEDINRINSMFALERIKIISPDGPTDYIRSALALLSEEEFNLFKNYQLSICERMDLIGAGSSVVDILRKV